MLAALTNESLPTCCQQPRWSDESIRLTFIRRPPFDSQQFNVATRPSISQVLVNRYQCFRPVTMRLLTRESVKRHSPLMADFAGERAEGFLNNKTKRQFQSVQSSMNQSI